ncbi:hypothetical protein Tco_1374890, partial [Tanacetum coccineum]
TTPSTTPIIEKIDRIENLIIDGKVTLLNDEGKPLKKDGYSTQSLLEQLKESYENDEYKYDLYEDDMYEGYEIPNKIQAICDYLDIKVRGQPLKRLDLRSKTLVEKLPGNYPSINELNITSDGVMGAFPSVQWDEPASIVRPERVSPWEIETFVAPIPTALAPPVATLKIKRPRMEIPNHGA